MMAKEKKVDMNILISQPVSSARILRTIAENKGFDNRKQFIEHLCKLEVDKYLNKQTKLEL